MYHSETTPPRNSKCKTLTETGSSRKPDNNLTFNDISKLTSHTGDCFLESIYGNFQL